MAHFASLRLIFVSTLVAACAAAGPAPSTSTSTTPPTQGGSSASKPAQHTAEVVRVDALLAEVRAKHDIPALGGATIDLERGLVAIGVDGVRARGKEARVTVEDRWHLGSCTKAMTATLAAVLVARGKLEWSTTVSEAFPKLGKKIDEKWRDVPLEWLLQNRGGAPGEPPPELWRELWLRDRDPQSARRWFAEELIARPPEVEPGSKFVYSNQGFVIAGAMIEQRTGKDWEELMREELFEPLGMSSAGFGAPGKAGALDQPRGHDPDAIEPGPAGDNPRALGPAGTVHASLYDWAKFVHEHLRGAAGHKGLLSTAGFRRLHECPDMQAYAMGWKRSARGWAGGDVLTHAGSNTMWYCVVWIAPEKGVAFIATCNEGGDKAAKACDDAVVALAKARGVM